MKISWLEEKLSINGSIRRIVELSNRLTERGHRVTIYDRTGQPCQWLRSWSRHRKQADFLTDRHEVVIFNAARVNHYELMQQVDARLKAFYLLGMPEKENLPLLKEQLTTEPPTGGFGIFKFEVFRRVLYSPDYLVMTNASWMHKWLYDELALDTVPVVGGVNLKMFQPCHKRVDWTADLNIRASGDPRKHKGSDTVIEAVGLLSNNLDRSIEFDTYFGLGLPQNKMAEWYSQADLFLDAQIRAGWNNPVAEAMACGVPVVCTDIGGVEDFAIDGETALLVPTDNPRAMASAAKTLLTDSQLQERLRTNALERIKQFDWDNTTTVLERTLEARL